MKKLVVLFLVMFCVVLISWVYVSNMKSEQATTQEQAIEVKKATDFVKYSLKGAGSFFSIVNNPMEFYSLISISEESPSRGVFSIDKRSRLKNSIYTTKHGENGQIISLAGNEKYLVWLDQNTDDYLNTMIVYDIAQKKILATIESSEKKFFDAFLFNEDTIYWIESDTTKVQMGTGTGEDKDTMTLGNYSGEIRSYNIVRDRHHTIDTIETVNYPNNELTVSRDKLWYIDNRDFEETALIKTYDFNTKEIVAYDLKEQFLGHLKPVDNNSVAFFKYTIHAAPVGMYLYNTSSRKISVINDKETDNRSAYDGEGRIISGTMSYKISKDGEIRVSDTIQRKYNDNFYFSSVGPFSTLSFTTSTGAARPFNTIIEFKESSLNWKSEIVQ